MGFGRFALCLDGEVIFFATATASPTTVSWRWGAEVGGRVLVALLLLLLLLLLLFVLTTDRSVPGYMGLWGCGG